MSYNDEACIPVYEGVDLFDVAGPYEMSKWVDPSRGLEVVIVSADGRAVKTMNGPALANGSLDAVTALFLARSPHL